MSYNLDDVMRRADMDPNDIIKHGKLLQMLKYQQAKELNPNLNQQQICGLIGTSKSKVYRNRIDLNMDLFHRYRVPVKHRSKPKHISESEDGESQKTSNKSRSKSTSKSQNNTSNEKSSNQESSNKSQKKSLKNKRG